MLEQLKQNFNELWKLFLRPYRHTYSLNDLGFLLIKKNFNINYLGPAKFIVENEPFIRKDFSIRNAKGLLLQGSYFCPLKSLQKRPFVIYCHCNSGSRMEALQYANGLLSNGFGLCCFDFSGSGLSEGEYVTLGYNESEDLQIIITMLKESGLADDIFLWGRSMGAVTVLNYMLKYKDQKISGLILDSPYCNLRNLAIEMAQSSIKLPKFMISPFVDSIDKEIKKIAGFSLNSMNLVPLLKNHKMEIPALFITSKKDSVVSAYHVEELKNLWGSQAKIKYVGLEHYENRGDSIIESCRKFLQENMKNPPPRRSNSFSNSQFRTILAPTEMPLKPVNGIKLLKK